MPRDTIISTSRRMKFIMKNGHFLVIQPETGSWIIVNSLGKKLLLFLKSPHSIEDIGTVFGKEAVQSLTEFYRAGIVNINKEQSIVSSISNFPNYEQFPALYIFFLTSDCNLACRYCYANGGDSQQNMSFTIIKKIVDKILEIPQRKMTFEFHGGEPLLLFPIIRQTIKYTQKKSQRLGKKINFRLQTNATLINKDIAKYLRDNEIGIGVSIDGPAIIHNKNRIYRNQQGSFGKVMRGIELLKREDVHFGVLAVITNIRDYQEVFDFFVNHDLLCMKLNVHFQQGRSLQPYFNFKEQKALAFEHIAIFNKAISYTLKNGKPVILLNVIHMLENITSWERRYMCLRSPCGAGISIIAIDPKADIYPCTEAVGDRNLCIGNILENRSLAKIFSQSPIMEKLKTRNVEKIQKCRYCIWKNFCGGGCTSKSYYRYASFNRECIMCKYNSEMFLNLIWTMFNRKEEMKIYMNKWWKLNFQGFL